MKIQDSTNATVKEASINNYKNPTKIHTLKKKVCVYKLHHLKTYTFLCPAKKKEGGQKYSTAPGVSKVLSTLLHSPPQSRHAPSHGGRGHKGPVGSY